MTRDEFLQKQKEFLFEKQQNDELEWQDLTDMRSEHFGVSESRDTIRKGAKLINEYISAGWDLVSPSSENHQEPIAPPRRESFEQRVDGTCVSDRLIEICEGKDITPEFLLAAHGLSPKDWKVAGYVNTYKSTQVKDGERREMYQSRLSVKPYKDDEISQYAIKEWFDSFESKPIQYSKITPTYGSGDNCLLLPIVDLHYNLRSSKFVTGNEYNCQIAKDMFLSVIDDVIERVKDKHISKIIFPLGNDLFNANGIAGTTFKGTPQTNEKHIFEAYTELYEVFVHALTKLSSVAPVDVVYIPSNHDKEVTFYFVHNLYTQFKNSDGRVTVDYSPITNKYRRFGNSVLMFSHDGKVDKMGNIVLDEASDMMGGAKFVEVLLAHLHSETVRQERNVTLRRLPTFSGRSDWSCEQNYGANRVSQSFIFNDKRNITDILYTMV